MAKKTKTEKDTSRLLKILGESVRRRYMNFFIGLAVVVGGLFIFAIFFHKAKVKPEERKSFCRVRTESYLKSVYSNDPNQIKLQSGYFNCQREFGSSFELDCCILFRNFRIDSGSFF